MRAKQLGFSIDELAYLTIGDIFDMMAEQHNDGQNYDTIATQSDIDRFFG